MFVESNAQRKKKAPTLSYDTRKKAQQKLHWILLCAAPKNAPVVLTKEFLFRRVPKWEMLDLPTIKRGLAGQEQMFLALNVYIFTCIRPFSL